MFDIQIIRQDPEKIKEAIQKKGVDPSLIDQLLKIDNKRRELLQQIEAVRAKKNTVEKKIVQQENKEEILATLKEVKKFLGGKDEELAAVNQEYQKIMNLLPNPPLEDVPPGRDERDNVVLREVGKRTVFRFTPKNYLTLGEQLDIIDTKRAAKTSGSRFGFLKREAALLEIALVKFAFDRITKKGFIPVIPPVLIKHQPFWGMGYLDRGKDEVYYLPKDDLYLAGTSEQMLGSMHMDETFDEEDLPKRYVAFSSCFRREAGSYGKDTKGILRVHQFDKVEMFVFSKPEEAKKEHEFLLSLEEELMKALAIPYRVVNICAGDLGDPAAAKYDIEAWLPGQNNGAGQYRETHSTSNCTDFQSRRLHIKFRSQKEKEAQFVYTLNGTGLAIGRTIIAIIENYQTREGFIKIPRVLVPYMGRIKVIKR